MLVTSCKDDVSFMPSSTCRATCTDDATGKTYGIAFRAMAWNDQDDPVDSDEYGCYLYVDAYQGEIDEAGEFISEPTRIADLQRPGDVGYVDIYSLKFYASSFQDDLSLLWSEMYPLLDESTIQIAQTDSSILAQYEHKINPCVFDSIVTVTATCNTESDGYTNIFCDVYQADDLEQKDAPCDNCENIKCPDGEGEACFEDSDDEDLSTSLQSLISEIESES